MKVTILLTQADRDMFDRIDRDCIAMHVPTPPKTFLKLEVRDGAGEVVEVYQDRAHSWVRNAYNILAVIWAGNRARTNELAYGAGTTQSKTSSGSQFTPGLNIPAAALGQYGRGIIIGSQDDAESFDSYSLGMHITHGTTAGKLLYNAESLGTILYDDGLKKYTFPRARVFNNNSGGSIDVKEVGLALEYSSETYVLISRDLLASTVTVPNAGQLTVTYTIEMTFPA